MTEDFLKAFVTIKLERVECVIFLYTFNTMKSKNQKTGGYNHIKL